MDPELVFLIDRGYPQTGDIRGSCASLAIPRWLPRTPLARASLFQHSPSARTASIKMRIYELCRVQPAERRATN